MSYREKEKFAVMTDEEVNMHWLGDIREGGGCSVGWAQNGTLRFFNIKTDRYWLQRAFDYASWLKKREYTLPERYNYNPFDFTERLNQRGASFLSPDDVM